MDAFVFTRVAEFVSALVDVLVEAHRVIDAMM
jgi:hypothetical protein